jgi:hypothetical protein
MFLKLIKSSDSDLPVAMTPEIKSMTDSPPLAAFVDGLKWPGGCFFGSARTNLVFKQKFSNLPVTKLEAIELGESLERSCGKKSLHRGHSRVHR